MVGVCFDHLQEVLEKLQPSSYVQLFILSAGINDLTVHVKKRLTQSGKTL